MSPFLVACQVPLHFFAHHSAPIAPTRLGRTKCYWLADVNFERTRRGPGKLKPGCMGVLSWYEESDRHFSIVDEPWISEVAAVNWRDL